LVEAKPPPLTSRTVPSAGQNIWLESRYLPVLSEKEVVTRIILLASPAPAPLNAEPQ
jgi:hypothetical protein